MPTDVSRKATTRYFWPDGDEVNAERVKHKIINIVRSCAYYQTELLLERFVYKLIENNFLIYKKRY